MHAPRDCSARVALIIASSFALPTIACGGGETDIFGNTSPPASTDASTGGCKTDVDCASSLAGGRCDQASGSCGGCSTTNDDCPPSQVCKAGDLVCVVGCKSDADCESAGGNVTCDTTTHQCVGCQADAECPPGAVCDSSQHCVPGCTETHACQDGSECCSGSCAGTSSDPANCGGCAHACAVEHGQAGCSGGECVIAACDSGFADCDGLAADGCEIDVETDASHCGACAQGCSPDNVVAATCSAGTCDGVCEAGWVDCDSDKLENGCEVYIGYDPDNCGACGVTCSTDHVVAPTCVIGICAGTCVAGWSDCDADKQSNGCETGTADDAANCGGCGVACSNVHLPAPTCAAGTCGGACEQGFADCDGSKGTTGCETDIAANPIHCGGCFQPCSSEHVTPSCSAGTCDGPCVAGYADCNSDKKSDGCEVALDSSIAHCGACGVACSSNHVTPWCMDGTCSGPCAFGYADCDGDKQANGCEVGYLGTDPVNCGTCGAVCSANHIPNPTCAGGACTGACEPGYTDCNTAKLWDGCEVWTAGDVANCGGCGVACSPNHVLLTSCGSGVCDGACEVGYGDCDGNKQTNGCEVDTETDPNHCGGCGVSCSNAHVAVRTCAGSVCTGACASGWADCDGDKLSNGCETDVGVDANCGACGNVCPSGENCSGGSCVPCNPSVLLLSDGAASFNVSIKAALDAAGLPTTLITNGVETYAGSPAASGFGTVILLVGSSYGPMNDMAAVGQQSIKSANAAGTGVVLTEFAGYNYNYAMWTTLKPLVLLKHASDGTGLATLTLTSPGHPIWDGLPATFASTQNLSWTTGTIVNGGSAIATWKIGAWNASPAVVVRDGPGRVAHLAWAPNYYGNWLNDANLVALFTNAASWTVRCE